MEVKNILKKNATLKGVLFSSFAMGFAGLGDALLYLVLPIYGEKMGFSVFWIGVFLSVNRFIRIPGNTLVAHLIAKKGYKKAMLIATFFAMLTTFFYGFRVGVFLFFISRIFWGLSYSVMRVSSLVYAAEAKRNINLMFGIVESVKTASAVLALFVGSYLIKIYNVNISFIVLGILSFSGLLFSLILPKIKTETTKLNTKKVLKFSTISVLTFLTSFIIDGVLVVTISKLLTNYSVNELVIVVSSYLMFRKVCSALLSILSGWISDIFGVQNIFKIALIFILIGILLIMTKYSEIGIIIVFLFNSVVIAMLPSIALKFNSDNRLETLTSITTWWDIGAATGTLLGLYLLELMDSTRLFGALFCMFFIAVFFFFKKSASFSKP